MGKKHASQYANFGWLLQYYNRVHFIYTLIINILQFLLSSAYNFTITIYILLYDTD